MANTIHLGEKYREALLEGFREKSYTESSFSHALDQTFSGVRTVHVMSLKTEPLQDYNRNVSVGSGSRYGETTEVGDFVQTFTMTQDKALSLSVDKGNNAEQFNVKKAGAIMAAERDEHIVPVYNVEQYLPRCVESILAQTYENLEILLVDDGTKDNSGAICDAYARQDARVKAIHKKNGGLSSARNAGIDAATGEYLSFVDSDDWIEPDMYEKMMALMEKYSVRLVCAGRWDVSSETGEKTLGLCPPKEEVISGEELVRRIFHWENIDSAAWDKLYHRSLFASVRYPLGVICEDVPTTYRIALDAGQAAMLPCPVYNYYHRPGSITSSSVSEKTFHFSKHTEEIYPFIRDNYPGIADAARYLRVRSLAYNLLTLDLADKDTRQKFADEYRLSRKALRRHVSFLLTSPLFGRQERVADLLLAAGLYRPMRGLYHGVRPGKTDAKNAE